MAELIPTQPDPGHEDDHHHGEQSFVSKYLLSTDHKVIAMQYMFTGMAMALIGGFMAYAFRMQLAFPGMDVPFFGIVTPANYVALVTNHGAIMIFWVAMQVLIAAFGNYRQRLRCERMPRSAPSFSELFTKWSGQLAHPPTIRLAKIRLRVGGTFATPLVFAT